MIKSYINSFVDIYGDILRFSCIGLLLVFCVGTVLVLAFLRGKRVVKWSAGLLVVEYLVLLLILSIFARKIQAERTFNFTPFWSYRSFRDGNVLLAIQIVANVVAFVPIGLLLGCIFGQIKWWKVLLIGGSFSVLIETLQFLLKRGFVELDDVFHNVLGCMIGYMIYLGIVYLVKRVRKSRDAKRMMIVG